MPRYESGDFAPPAPVVRATVRGDAGGTRDGVPLLIDTGADVSIVPMDVADAVGAVVEDSKIAIRFYGGEEVVYSQAELTVEFLRYRFRGPFLLADGPHGILGRNVLNLLRLSLDGPHQSWSA